MNAMYGQFARKEFEVFVGSPAKAKKVSERIVW